MVYNHGASGGLDCGRERQNRTLRPIAVLVRQLLRQYCNAVSRVDQSRR
jgi:hypothetical protein